MVDSQLALQNFLRKETLVNAIGNGLVPAIAVFFTFNQLPIAAWGSDGFNVFGLRMIFVVTLIMTPIMTLVTRQRARRGSIPSLTMPSSKRGWLRYVPAQVWLRALLFAITALIALGAFMAVLTSLLGLDQLGRYEFTAFVFCLGALIGLVETRPILLSAMADTP